MNTKTTQTEMLQITANPFDLIIIKPVPCHTEELTGTSFKMIDNDFESFCVSLKIEKDDVILINSEMLVYNYFKHSDFAGIILLKWLRIYKRCANKIIISGFLPLQLIIESNPEHIILMAKGTNYLQYPFSKTDLEQTIQNTSVFEENRLTTLYRPFIKADFNIEQIGHSFANEFGLFLMQSIHEYIGRVRIECNYLKKDNALDFEKAKFFYFSDIDKPKLTNNQEELIEELLSVTVDNPSGPPKILYIDDQAELGWNKLFAGMLFNDPEDPNLITIPVKDILNEREIIQFIYKNEPSCILLDLRLKGNSEENFSIEEISGFKILKFIKSKYPSLPVIITSATNKAESLSALLKAGAEGLWTKPRVEDIKHTSQLYDYYFNLLGVVIGALTKFKTELEKKIFELDIHNNRVQTNFNHENLENSLFVFDTNYFICNSEDYHGFYDRLKSFISLHNILANRNLSRRILIVGDVLSELHKKSLEKINLKDENIFDVKLSAKYCNDLILDFLESKHEIVFNDYQLEKQLVGSHVDYYSVPEGGKVMLFKQVRELVDKFDNPEEAENEKGKIIALRKKTILHADDTFKFVVTNMFLNVSKRKEISNIYFVSNDLGCNYNVYRYITNQNFKFFNTNSPPRIRESPDGKKLNEAAIYFNHNKSEKRNLFIYESSKFLSTFYYFDKRLQV